MLMIDDWEPNKHKWLLFIDVWNESARNHESSGHLDF